MEGSGSMGRVTVGSVASGSVDGVGVGSVASGSVHKASVDGERDHACMLACQDRCINADAGQHCYCNIIVICTLPWIL